MPLINIANPLTLLLAVIVTVGFIYIGKEAKNSLVPLVPLVAFLVLLVMHVLQLALVPLQSRELVPIFGRCLAVDFVMILVSYIAYLWVDDIEAKIKRKKSIDNSLEWFWRNV